MDLYAKSSVIIRYLVSLSKAILIMFQYPIAILIFDVLLDTFLTPRQWVGCIHPSKAILNNRFIGPVFTSLASNP